MRKEFLIHFSLLLMSDLIYIKAIATEANGVLWLILSSLVADRTPLIAVIFWIIGIFNVVLAIYILAKGDSPLNNV